MQAPGELLRTLREGRGETLAIAAAALGIDGSHLSRIERGLVMSIDVKLAFQIQERYGIPAAQWAKDAA